MHWPHEAKHRIASGSSTGTHHESPNDEPSPFVEEFRPCPAQVVERFGVSIPVDFGKPGILLVLDSVELFLDQG